MCLIFSEFNFLSEKSTSVHKSGKAGVKTNNKRLRMKRITTFNNNKKIE